MSVRCKFRALSVTKHFSHVDADGTIATSTEVRLLPVQNKGSDENVSFWKATPSGELVMRINNPAAALQFEVGRCYYVDFSPAPE